MRFRVPIQVPSAIGENLPLTADAPDLVAPGLVLGIEYRPSVGRNWEAAGVDDRSRLLSGCPGKTGPRVRIPGFPLTNETRIHRILVFLLA